MRDDYCLLKELAKEVNLPEAYLKDLANAGRIPFLEIKGVKVFSPTKVSGALEEIADGNMLTKKYPQIGFIKRTG